MVFGLGKQTVNGFCENENFELKGAFLSTKLATQLTETYLE